jgi:hypothetical protein
VEAAVSAEVGGQNTATGDRYVRSSRTRKEKFISSPHAMIRRDSAQDDIVQYDHGGDADVQEKVAGVCEKERDKMRCSPAALGDDAEDGAARLAHVGVGRLHALRAQVQRRLHKVLGRNGDGHAVQASMRCLVYVIPDTVFAATIINNGIQVAIILRE